MIFDSNIQHPLDILLETVEDVVGYIVLQDLIHYNSDPKVLKADITKELASLGILADRQKPVEDRIGKVFRVEVEVAGYTKRGIPTYNVSVYYVDWSTHIRLNGQQDWWGPKLVDLHVGILGIIRDEHI